MLKKLLIVIVAAAIVFGASALVLRDKNLAPGSFWYSLKRTGEWLDVNFLTIGAPEKQEKHLIFAGRRVTEFLDYSPLADEGVQNLARAYEEELAKSEFMAEQMAILDHKFIPLIESVYNVSLLSWRELSGKPNLPGQGNFLATSKLYNQYAVKNLLQKHQHTAADTLRYKILVEMRLAMVMQTKDKLAAADLATLQKAQLLLQQGKEMEWAYDLLGSINP